MVAAAFGLALALALADALGGVAVDGAGDEAGELHAIETRVTSVASARMRGRFVIDRLPLATSSSAGNSGEVDRSVAVDRRRLVRSVALSTRALSVIVRGSGARAHTESDGRGWRARNRKGRDHFVCVTTAVGCPEDGPLSQYIRQAERVASRIQDGP
ncbi:MAG TPA: hypothetical protein VFM38_06590 [Candidatus Limnocylindrales bacterium]|nr:hypothetical protein [Candidatus Limnocylindrales bacterium]